MTTIETPSAATPSPAVNAAQEIRFAVVMYGGISLAIYMHGVAQELLRLVRATSVAGPGNDEAAQIYKELSGKVRDQRPSLVAGQDPSKRDCVPTRFVIDILSGTSAGGINAVFLAKALAIGAQNLDDLRRMWLDDGDIDKILNRGGAFEPKRSLLNGQWMYQQLYEAFRDMKAGTPDPPPADQIDLFVTTTDLNGAWVPIQLADMNVPERVHTGCFNFRHDNMALAGGSGAPGGSTALETLRRDVDGSLDTLRRTDFTSDVDAMLAFACRCTSSFPIAFAPTKLADIAPVIGQADYERWVGEYEKFFRWIPPTRLVDIERPLTIKERELADGGYLDNKPFDHAIDAMRFCPTTRRHVRKLLFVDPFPEDPARVSDQPHFDFIQNAIAGSITLPHYQPIREQINRIKAANRVQVRLRAVQDRALSEDPPFGFPITSVLYLVDLYGSLYRSYHAVRLLDCTDDLASTFGRLLVSLSAEDAQLAVRYLVRVWREATYAPDHPNGRKLEAQFFDEFDFGFRMRRAMHLLEWAQGPEFRDMDNGKDLEPRDPRLCTVLINHLTRLRRRREQLSLLGSQNPIWSDIEPLGTIVTRDSIKSVLEPIDDDERMARARKLFDDNRASFERMAEAIALCWKDVFSLNREELREFLHPGSDLERQYRFFDLHDMASLTFLEGSDVSEHTETEIYRMSPADGIKRPLEQKLAGYRVQAFGAFLKREWRENDILWGRLDACERLVSAILTHSDDEKLRKEFVSRLQDAIVKQEAGKRTSRDLDPALKASTEGRLAQYMKCQYTLPDGPPPSTEARWLAEAADIVGRMIEEDVSDDSTVKGALRKNWITGMLRRFGGLVAQLVGLLTPGTLGRIFWNYWLILFVLASGLLLGYAWIAGDGHARILGERGLGTAVVVWLLSWVVGRLLASPKVPFWIRALKWLPVIVVLAVVFSGLRHVLQDAHDLWQRIWLLAAPR